MRVPTFLFVFLLLCTYTTAQTRVVVKVGGNMSSLTGKTRTSDFLPGYQFGCSLENYFGGSWGAQIGLILASKGGKFDSAVVTNGVDYYTPKYVVLPIHGAYRIKLTEISFLTFHAGPYVGYGVSGSAWTDVKGGPQGQKVDYFKADRMNEFDYGIGGGARFEVNDFIFNPGYDYGLANASRNSNFSNKNRSIYFTVGYMF